MDKRGGELVNVEMINHMKSLIGIEQGSEIELVFDSLMDQAPVIGKFISTYKIHRLGKRLSVCETEIGILSNKVELIDDLNFIEFLKGFLFPSLLEDMLNEDEDNKIEYFLNGFAYVIDEIIDDKSKVLIYYDVLRELRFIEIEYLISLTSEYKRFRNRKNNGNENITEMFYFAKMKRENREFGNLYWSIENKLERLGLIDTGRQLKFEEIMNKMNNALQKYQKGITSTTNPSEIQLTAFGKSFLNFFVMLEKYRD